MRYQGLTIVFFLFIFISAHAQNTFQSVQAGDWDDESTWFVGGAAGGTEGVDFPSAYDSVYINHDVDITATNSGSDFIIEGYLEVSAGNKLQSEIGSSTNGFALQGDGQMHVFGSFYSAVAGQGPGTVTPTDKEATLRGDSYFIAYTGSDIYIADDLEIEDNATVFFELSVCVRVHDDVNFTGTGWYMCGEGDISIGGDGASSNVSYSSSASEAQICPSTNVYRNTTGVTCTGDDLTTGTAATGPAPFAYDDFFAVQYETATDLDVLNQGTSDGSIIIGDTITLTSAGSNGAANDNTTTQGGTLSINNNGTPADLTDDYIVYTPPNSFTGSDSFDYVITNEDGVTETATVTIAVTCDGGVFAESAAAVGLDLGGAKDGGLTWYDLNRDDLVDVIVNTSDGTNDTRIYFQQSDGSFTDVTSTHAAALLTNNCDRTALAGDMNNDGYVDFVRNSFNRMEVWQNNGPSGSPAYSFTLVETFTTNSEGINIEGIAFVDWDQDGYLDLILDNDDSEIVLYENDQDGTFTEITSGTGLPTGDSGVGDYTSGVDWNNDGFIDFVGRKSDGGTSDFWEFDGGTGQWVEVTSPDLTTAGGEKGAVTFCDLDQDGDLDFIWAHESTGDDVSIYVQANDGSFTLGLTLVNDGTVEECDCADVDNDGDNDIFLGDDNGASYLYKNGTSKGGALSFFQDNDCIDPDDDVEGSEFVDFDDDGDMDLYMNINGAANQLWINAQNDNDFLIVEPRIRLNSGGNWRSAIGANVMLIACSDTCMIKDVSAGRGHGSQKPAKVHFGLGGSALSGSSTEYSVAIFFPDVNGTRTTVVKTITPSSLANNTLIVYDDESSDALCVGVDSDGDGTPDSEDEDDDNDGVLDVNECLGELVSTTETGFFTAANLAFTINGNVAVRTDPQILQAIAVSGISYNEFILPDSFDINYTSGSFDDTDARFLDAGVSQSQLSVDGETSFETTGLLSFQDADLNHYQMLDTPVDSTADYYDVYYDTPVLSNGKVYVAFSERGGNNRFAFEAFAPDGTAYNQRVELALADYIDSGFPVAAFGGGGSQNAEIAVLPITDLAPIGSTIGRIRSIPFTDGGDAGDGKVFIFGATTSLEGSCDSDGDGVENGLDLDSDNDGIPDIIESGGVDTDGDGLADNQTDTDGDGIVDLFDSDNSGNPLPNLDSDGDGVYDKNDLDADDDGIADVNEAGGTDENGDGRIDDYVDTDSDGFGDVVDADVGNDGTAENTANALITTGADNDNDGRPDSYNAGDFDGDVLPNHIDIDSDNDGITDVLESGQTDADTNGRADNYVDNDNDGFNDLVDGDSTNALAIGSDIDGNNTANAIHVTDSDGDADGRPDTYPTGDSDGDGLRDFTDIDADNDGITDNTEALTTAGYVAPSGTDTDGDGLDDSYDPDDGGTYTTPEDTDSDGTADYLDTNSDNDAEDDSVEGHDSDNDGTADSGSPASTGLAGGTTDADGDGLYDGWDNNTSDPDPTNTNLQGSSHPDDATSSTERDWRERPDNDNDGIPNGDDLDNDNDGIADADEDGCDDSTPLAFANTSSATTIDGDLTLGTNTFTGYTTASGEAFNVIITTSAESSSTTVGDGASGDNSVDGLTALGITGEKFVIEFVDAGTNEPFGLSGFDFYISDFETNGGFDEDIPEFSYQTADGDQVSFGNGNWSGWEDASGVAFGVGGSQLSTNVDGDLTTTYTGAGGTQDNKYARLNVPGALITSITVAQHNVGGGCFFAWANSNVNAVCDSDNDGVPNYLDLDSDNDGIPDIIEAGGEDTDGNGLVDNINTNGTLTTDTDANGLDDLYDAGNGGTAIANTDTDGDGLPNAQDLDADNDGIPDVTESNGTDVNGDGRADNFADTDGDGFNDVVDGDVGQDGTSENSADALILTGADTDNDGVPNSYPAGDFDGDDVYNFLDLDADDDGILDVTEVGGTDINRDGQADDFVDADNDGYNDEVDGDTDNSLAAGDDSSDDNIASVLVATGSDGGGDGNPDTYPNGNFDSDNNYNFLDIDADNDGITDNTEGQGTDVYVAPDGTDADGDGIDDAYDADDAAFGGEGSSFIPSDIDEFTDANSPDYLDLDSDGDGETDAIEGHDSDGDGTADASSPASTGVAGGTTDADGDGLYDGWDNNTSSVDPTNTTLQGTSHPDVDANAAERDWREATCTDTDRDGICNIYDLDDDNDGIPDTEEEECQNTESLTFADNTTTSTIDGDLTLGVNTFTGFTTADGTAYDVVITTSVETQSVTNGDGASSETTIDGYTALAINGERFNVRFESTATGDPVALRGFDFRVSDFETDGTFLEVINRFSYTTVEGDIIDFGNGNWVGWEGVNGTAFGVVGAQVETNASGQLTTTYTGAGGNQASKYARLNVPDQFITEFTISQHNSNGGSFFGWFSNSLNGVCDEDGDGIISRLDLDSDNDGIPDIVEAGGEDTDGNGIVDDVNTNGTLTADSDGDGLADLYDAGVSGNSITKPDTDGDGISDYLDLDSDNDGIPDVVEAGGTDTDGDGRFDDQTDTDGDGLADDVDGDVGNDGTSENTGDALQVTGSDTDNDGAPNSYPNDDADGDGIRDQLDLDADGDGIPDVVEAGGTDTDGDGFFDDQTDSDNDGFADIVDGDVGNDDTAENSANALQVTGADTDNDGAPNSFPSDDFDGDGIPNQLDIDSDDDGITDVVEAGGTDANEDGREDGSGADSDNDGLDDGVDGDVGNDGTAENTGNAQQVTGADTDDDGAPNSFPSDDSDGDGLPDQLDIDADNDGITDNTEAQTTAGYVAPSGVDTDGDGLDDSYDPDCAPCGGVTGSYITPVNTESSGLPDYLDTDSDDDGELDAIEGHDSNGDGTADSGSPSDSGVSGGSTDADGDGLLDGYDNNTSSSDPTNGSLSGSSHPDADGGDSEADWREVPCDGGSVILAPDNATTTANDFCTENGFTYYYNPSDPTELLFAIEHTPTGGNTNDFTVSVDLTVSSNPTSEAGVFSAEDVGAEQATFVMGRYYNISITSGSLNGNVNVRFFYDTDESDTLAAVADRWNQANAGGTANVSGLRWFSMNSGTFDPGSADLQSTGIQGSSEQTPTATATEDGVDYAQFSLSSLTGGGLAYSVGVNSVVLPVEWLSFTAEKQGETSVLDWATASERNSEIFFIERSTAADQSWNTIGSKAAVGESQVMVSYSFIDRNPAIGVNYYRLRQVDFDGAFEYSETREVLFTGDLGNGGTLEVFPNPTSGDFTLVYPYSDAWKLAILDEAGKIVYRSNLPTGEKQAQVHLDVIAAGVYQVVLQGSQEVLTNRLIVTP